MIDPQIKILGVSKAFSLNSILKNVNISFFSGEVIGISGANGSGKTTFIKMLCGLISPDCGTITINGFDITFDRVKVMQSMGVLLDGPRSLYWRLSAWENYKYFSGLKGIFGDTANIQGQKLLQLFDLWELRHEAVESYSLGMKQKLSICCALSHNPKTIILDEPTTALDYTSKTRLKELIMKFSKENKTVIVTSHELEILKEVCDRQVTIANRMLLENPL